MTSGVRKGFGDVRGTMTVEERLRFELGVMHDAAMPEPVRFEAARTVVGLAECIEGKEGVAVLSAVMDYNPMALCPNPAEERANRSHCRSILNSHGL